MALDTLDSLVAAERQNFNFVRASFTTLAANYSSLYRVSGFPGANATAGATPGLNGAVCTSADAGAIPFTDPSSGLSTYLEGCDFMNPAGGCLIVYDRLWHNTNLSLSTASAQAVSAPSLTRPDSLGAGVEMWLEFIVAPAAAVTSRTATVTYTDQSGNTGATTTATIPDTVILHSAIPLGVASGDTGVRAVTSFQLSGAMTAGAGEAGLVLMRKLAVIPLDSSRSTSRNFFDLKAAQVYDDACIAFMLCTPSTTAGVTVGALTLAQG